MKDPVTLDKIVAKFGEVQNRLLAASENETDPASKETITQIVEQLKTAQQQYVSSFNQVMADVEKQRAQSAGKLDEAKASIAEAKSQIAARKEKAAQVKKPGKLPKPKPAIEIDPTLGKTLREELLERFGKQVPRPAEGSREDGPAWSDWIGNN